MSKKIEVPEEQLQELLRQNKEFKQDRDELIIMVKNIIKVLGLTNANGDIKPEIISGETSPLKIILKKLSGIVLDITLNPKKIEAEFEFVKNIIPLLAKYAEQNKNKTA